MPLNTIAKFAIVLLAFYLVCSYMNTDVEQSVVHVAEEQPAGKRAPFEPGQQSKTTDAPAPIVTELGSASVPTTISVSQPVPGAAPVTVSVTQPANIAPSTAPTLTPSLVPTNVTATGFSAAPLDLDELFDQSGTLSAAELLPKNEEANIFADVKADPAFDKSFLSNRWLAGIDVSTAKRYYSNDLRGAPPPVTVVTVSPFNQPTRFPDQYSRSIKDVC